MNCLYADCESTRNCIFKIKCVVMGRVTIIIGNFSWKLNESIIGIVGAEQF